ncbi:MAG: hypothetical protein IT428_03890, partial [Planctomycetaceae bacterium]|nr:hypothetical protein [Planctomycetaceae bacterium]
MIGGQFFEKVRGWFARETYTPETVEERLRSLSQEEVFAITRHIMESAGIAVPEDADQMDWSAGKIRLDIDITPKERKESLWRVRYLAKKQPNVIQSLRLYKTYVLGRGFKVSLKLRDPEAR